MAYGFVRSSQDAQAYDQYAQAGIRDILLNAEDPYLAQAYADAIKKGLHPGIWLPSKTGVSPDQYVAQAAMLAQRYHPSVLVPDVEFEGKGYQGSPGWDWSAKTAQMLRAALPSQKFAVSMMPNQADFNYGAWQNVGVNDWLPQAYGATYNQLFDPTHVGQALRDFGVKGNVNVILAPGQKATTPGLYGAYALDDFHPDQLQALAQYNAQPQRGFEGQPLPKPSSSPPQPRAQQQPQAQIQAPSAAALAYSRQALANLAKRGYTASKFGIQGDPTAQWRALSGIAGAIRARSAGQAQAYQVRAGTDPHVAEAINNILRSRP